jgi:hypothetical protein
MALSSAIRTSQPPKRQTTMHPSGVVIARAARPNALDKASASHQGRFFVAVLVITVMVVGIGVVL